MIQNIVRWFGHSDSYNQVNLPKSNKYNSAQNDLSQQYKYTSDNNSAENIVSLLQSESKVWQGIKLQQKNNLAEAIECFRQAVKLNDRSAVVHHILAIALKKQGNLSEANFYHRKALLLGKINNIEQQNTVNSDIFNSNNQNERHDNNQSQKNISCHKPSKLIVFPKITAIAPGKYIENTELEVAKIYLQQAEAYYEEKLWQEAINACREALKICPDLPEVYKVYGNSLLQLDRIAEAIGFYAKAIAINPNFAEVYANIGNIYSKQSQWKQAIDYYQKALDANPKLVRVYLSLSRIWEKLQEQERALDCLLQALKLEPEIFNIQQHFQLADELLEEGKIEVAIGCYKHAIKLEPNCQDAYRKLIKALEQNGKWQEAEIYYQEILRIHQKNLKSIDSSSQLIKKNRIERLLNNINSNIIKPQNMQLAQTASNTRISKVQVSQSSNSLEAKLHLADLHASQKKWSEAIHFYQQAIKLKPDSAIAYNKLADVYRKINKPRAFTSCLYISYVLQPESVSAKSHFILGTLLVNQDKIAEATTCFRKALELEPKFIQAQEKLYEIINVYQQQFTRHGISEINYYSVTHKSDVILDETSGKKKVEDFTSEVVVPRKNYSNSTLDRKPKETLVEIETKGLTQDSIIRSKNYYELGIDAEQKEDWKLATVCYQHATIINSHDWKSNYSLGAVLSKQELWKEAIDAYNQSIKINSEYFWTHHHLGEALLELKQWKTAIKPFKKAIEINPNFSWSHYKLGIALMQLKQMRLAANQFRSSIKLNPDFDWVHHKLGDVLVALEDWDGAINAYRRAIEITPNLPQTTEKLNDALRKRSELDRSQVKDYYQTAIKQEPERESLHYKVLEVNPEDVKSYISLAEINATKGNKDIAIAFYKIALQIQPNNSEIITALDKLKS